MVFQYGWYVPDRFNRTLYKSVKTNIKQVRAGAQRNPINHFSGRQKAPAGYNRAWNAHPRAPSQRRRPLRFFLWRFKTSFSLPPAHLSLKNISSTWMWACMATKRSWRRRHRGPHLEVKTCDRFRLKTVIRLQPATSKCGASAMSSSPRSSSRYHEVNKKDVSRSACVGCKHTDFGRTTESDSTCSRSAACGFHRKSRLIR